MIKRNKFISTPHFDFSRSFKRLNLNNIDSIDIQDTKPQEQIQEDLKFYRNIQIINDLRKREIEEDLKLNRNMQIIDDLIRQNKLIIREPSPSPVMMSNELEFKAMLGSVEKFNTPRSRMEPTTTTTSKLEMSTFVALVDETEVRMALKNDPLVKRILKLAKNKNMKYLKQFSGGQNR